MANTAANVRVGVTGTISYAIPGTAIPTTNVAVLNVAFVDQGYVTEEGIKQTIADQTTDVRAWQGGDLVRRIISTSDLTYMLSLLETSAASLKTFYNDYTAGTIQVKAQQGIRGRWVFDVVDGASITRVVIPDGQVTERGDINYVNSDAVKYPITITCYPEAVTGVKAYIYTGLA